MKIEWSRARQMTDEEIGTLFRQSYPRLYRLAYSLLQDKEESRDVVSGAFLDLLDRRKLTADIQEGYLWAMVRSRSLDFLRRKQVADEARVSLLCECKPYVFLDVEHDERIREIRQFIEEELTPQTRKVLQLCYDEKRTYREVASELGVSVQAVNKHISHALRKLRERFNPASIQSQK